EWCLRRRNRISRKVARIVFITGAARGIGRATALAFAKAGDDLLLTDICAPIEACPYPLASREDLEETAELCRKQGCRAVTAIADVRRADEVADAVRCCRDQLGPIDVLVNNAGLVGPAGVTAHELSEE